MAELSSISTRMTPSPASRTPAEPPKDNAGSERLKAVAKDLGGSTGRTAQIEASLNKAAASKAQQDLDKAASALTAGMAAGSANPAAVKTQTGAAQNVAKDNLAAQVKAAGGSAAADRLKAVVNGGSSPQANKPANDSAINRLASLAAPKSNSSTRGNVVNILA
jgi:hypothetical protein